MSREQRKWDHIRFALGNEQKSSSAFHDIKFLHNSLPNSSVSHVRLDSFIGELYLSSPIFINAMTGGGGEKTYSINQKLAIVAKEKGLAMAVGSQMAAIKDPLQRYTYEIVRKENPSGIVIANLGSEATLEHAKAAIEMVEADALQIHLNVIQELTMPEGDRDFRDALKRIEMIIHHVQVPVIVKEVGFGMSRETVQSLSSIGVQAVDIGGFGGTNFATIENKRRLQEYTFFEDWGIPTPISIVEAAMIEKPISIIGSGGFSNALEMLKGLALGADAIGVAGYFLKILVREGIEKLMDEIDRIHNEMLIIMTALGAESISKVKNAPLIISGETYHWLNQRGIDTRKYSQRSIT
ncbi:type 2 isopentenyl-diphosphate Delta-isomerase [Neobacillus thermocopriae]|uniref:type 2 isopentenyl-diphosphate Delta-isomerase n=1 Tax=Neobacillus thermocopriae TaxID=1215031 RepID=UPI002E21C002|nr:type 2 isopentenyl-diphosphate Delta-isomerase [Neobacillus thermocopriae]MED3625307.1 type 2 isopentenyl-diphosphate Delta-isomerase [Neobacillus thermocopriae]MED3715453.1 type 2 isopentenyl-diphosphate Delta-isomerase [Neobacillus thermocopriae]